MKRRATTKRQRQEIMRRLLAAWNTEPYLRFGQFLHICDASFCRRFDLFNVEDYDLVELLEAEVAFRESF